MAKALDVDQLKLDDTLRQRTDKLQAQRQAILNDIARLKTKATVPPHILQKKHIDAFTRLVREKLFENGAFAKEYLHLLVRSRTRWREIRTTSWKCPDLPLSGSPTRARTWDLHPHRLYIAAESRK